MAYVVPTPTDVRTTYPEFAGVADGVIEAALAKGGLVIDQTWPVAAFGFAYQAYAAHLLRLQNLGTSSASLLAADLPFGAKRYKAGDTEIELQAGAGGFTALPGSAAWYMLTPYGQEFLMMQRRYFGGPRVY